MSFALLTLLACSEYLISDVNKGVEEPLSDTESAQVQTDIDPDTDTAGGTGDTERTEEELCEEAAEITGFLDDYQTTEDGRVLFCHSGSGNSYVLLDSDISSCTAHLDHPHDVFPTTGCDS